MENGDSNLIEVNAGPSTRQKTYEKVLAAGVAAREDEQTEQEAEKLAPVESTPEDQRARAAERNEQSGETAEDNRDTKIARGAQAQWPDMQQGSEKVSDS